MISTEFLSSLDKFDLIIKKRVTSKYSGARASMATGRGSTIKDYRIYAPGDDIRLVDWKIYARTDDLYIKRYEEERNLTVHIIIDFSASMNYGSVKKSDYAGMIGVGFAYLAMKDNEKFQFSTFSNTLEIFQPRRGMSHLASMVEHLNKMKPSGNSNFKDTISKYKHVLGSKALVVIVSDFLFDMNEIKEALYMLGDNDIKIIQVLDKTEKDLVVAGDVKLKDLESNQIMRTYISQRLKNTYQKKLENHNNEIKKTCIGMHANFYSISTDTPIFDAFYEILR